MYRASTPSVTLILPSTVDYTKISKMVWYFEQNGEEILKKELSQLSANESNFSVILTQEETNMFDADKDLVFQARIKTNDGAVVPTKKVKLRVDDVINDEVL